MSGYRILEAMTEDHEPTNVWHICVLQKDDKWVQAVAEDFETPEDAEAYAEEHSITIDEA